MSNPNDTRRPWVIWCVNHKLYWLLVILAWCFLPVYLLIFLPEAYSDILYTVRNLKEPK